MKKVVLLLFVVSSVFSTFCQDLTDEVTESKTTLGLGIGLDYGGLGGQINFQINPKVELFGGLGYNLDGAGFNVGGKLRLAPDKRVCPTIGAMYGYNGVIVVEGLDDASKTYYGPSFGFGLEFKRHQTDNFWNVGLWLPIRSSEFKDDFDALDKNPDIEISKPLPVAISIAYHFKL
jgi:hypothetical protein